MKPEGLSEQEELEWVRYQLALHGWPKRGRPKKGEERLKLADLGFTRQQVHIARKLAEIPTADLEAYLAQNGAEVGKRLSQRAILTHFGKINVITGDIFDDTDIGRRADEILEIVNAIGDGFLDSLSPRQLKWLGRSLNHKLRNMAVLRELEDTAVRQ